MKKMVRYLPALAFALAAGSALAATPAASGALNKPVTQVSCQDYVSMDQSIKPKFIYYAVGHSKKGTPDAVLDIDGIDKIQPQLDKYCQVNLTKNAYDEVMKTSIASEKTNR